MSRLPICEDPNSPCWGHPCDNCYHCRRGQCCGEAVREANLPAVGSWQGTIHVPLGQMEVTTGGLVVCHICGEQLKALWMHINRKHGIDAHEYRAYFGLRTSEPLCSPLVYEARSDRMGAVNARSAADAAERLEKYRQDFTPEQRSLWSRNREQRLQAQGESVIADFAAAGGQAWHSRRQQDPEADSAWRGKLIVAKRRMQEEGTACVVCGVRFCVLTSRAVKQRSPRKTCGSPECRKEIKRRAQAAAAAARRARVT